MASVRCSIFARAVVLLVVLPVALWPQSAPALLNGTVTDPTGAVIPNAEVTVTETSTGVAHKVTTGSDGLYAFPQLPPGAYEMKVSASGFRDFAQRGIRLNLGDKFRIDVKLEVGAAQQTVEVMANASPLNFENAEQKGGISPETMGELPLMVNNGVRSAAQFVTLLPGASSPTGDALGAHLNGAVRYSGEALLNGASLINPSGGQGMYSAAMDFAQSPDMVSELKVLQANYEPQYGSTGGAVLIMETKSGTNQFHGSVFEYLRNTSLNARQFNAPFRPKDIENDFGLSVGGPVKIPGAWTHWNKTYFFFNWEGFRQRGAPTREWMTIPSALERQGDFSDWVDTDGNLIPIYDPLTTRTDADGTVHRDQFMGCDGQHPNVICPDRFQNAPALQWMKNLPPPSIPGAKFNYLPAGVGSNWNADMSLWNVRIDEYLGNKDHITASIFHRELPTHTESRLPDIISNDSDTYKYTWANRLNWDHVFSPTLLYHFSGGYDHDYFQQGGHDGKYADQLPQIPGAPLHAYPPHITFGDDFTSFGTGQGAGKLNKWPAPAFIANQMVTWVKGKHTWKFGFEYRNQRNSNLVHNNESGTFYFDGLQTGLLNVNSGNSIASFLLDRVSSGNFDYRPYPLWSARWGSWIAHAGDTWKMTPKLSVNLGIRWEMHKPSVEQHDVMSFFDAGGTNPSAGNRAGRLAFAGTRWGDVSYGKRYPEDLFQKGFSPRIGIAYAFNQKTVIRTGYGIFYDAGYYPGWGSGVAQDGFNAAGITFGASNGGLDPAFLLSQGLPDNWTRPPFLDPGYLNGQWGPNYRPKDGNRLPYSQQWNLAIERQFTENMYINVAYVGTKGTRLISRVAALNALNPSLLKQYGEDLFHDFQPGDTSFNGVPIPYEGWIEQMSACSPSLAQALLPYPQYCGPLQGVNENAGNSSYHSLQVKFEKRFSKGLWVLSSYTWGKILTDTESNQPDEMAWGGMNGGMISPYERRRNKALSSSDVSHTFTTSFIYSLPVGKGQRWVNRSRFLDLVVGGWQTSGIIRLNAGTPFAVYSSNCSLPGQFRMGCLPGQIPSVDPFAQDKGSFNPDLPLINVDAFQNANDFQFVSGQGFVYGSGARMTNFRGFPFHNVDFSMTKAFHITESKNVSVRADFFNLFNMHVLRGFDTDVASPTFGMWNGNVTPPRYVQLGARFSF